PLLLGATPAAPPLGRAITPQSLLFSLCLCAFGVNPPFLLSARCRLSMLLWVRKRISYSHATIRIGKAGPIGKGRQESAVGPAAVHEAFGVQRLPGGSAPDRPAPGGPGGRGAVRLDARPDGRGPDHD